MLVMNMKHNLKATLLGFREMPLHANKNIRTVIVEEDTAGNRVCRS